MPKKKKIKKERNIDGQTSLHKDSDLIWGVSIF